MMIEIINSYLQWLGAETVGRLWLPLLLWTAAAFPIYGLLRWREMGTPHVRYYILQALLLALPVGLLIGELFEAGALFQEGTSRTAVGDAGAAAVITLPDIPSTAQSPAAPGWNIYHGLGFLTLLAGMLAAWRLLMLAGEAFKIYLLRRRLEGRYDRRVHHMLVRLRRQMGLRRHLEAVVTSRDTVPMTFGLFRPTIVIPVSMARRPDQLRMILAHELTHIRRRDYLRGLIERLIGGFFAIHPLTGWLCRKIGSCREISCDMEVLELLSCGKRAYASLLFETSLPAAGRAPFALAMSDSPGRLKRRIRAMKAHAGKNLTSARTAGLAAGFAVLLLAVLFSGCASRTADTYVNVKIGAWELIIRSGAESRSSPELTAAAPTDEKRQSPEPAADPSSPEQTSRERSGSRDSDDGPEVFVAVEQMPRLKGGLSGLADKIDYPEEARQAGIEGIVIVQFVVDEQGSVVDPTVLRGIGAGCDREAVEVVRQAEFEPGRQQGTPVHVKMSLPVRFALGQENNQESNTRSSSAASLQIRPDETLLLNNERVLLARLPDRLNQLPEAAGKGLHVLVDGETSMAFVSKVQKRIRRTAITRITYEAL